MVMKRVVVTIAFLLLCGGVSTAQEKDLDVVRIDSLSTQTIFTKPLVGKVPGVMVFATDGMPDSTPDIYFRGYSVYGGSPFILLNGLPFFGDISSLNVNDIESVTVLKDVSDVLVYGDNASNGILSVRTRQASQKGISVTASWRTGAVLRQSRDYRTMDTPQYLETWWEAYRNEYLQYYSPAEAGNRALEAMSHYCGLNAYGVPANQVIDPATGKFIAQGDPLWKDDLNWRDYVEHTGILHDGSLAISLGSRRADLRAHLGYTDDNSYVIGAGLQRYTASLNAEVRPFAGFKVAASVLGTVSSRTGWQSGYSEDPFSFVRNIGNLSPVHLHNADGSYKLSAEGEPVLDFGFDSRSQYAGKNGAGMMEFDRNNETKRRMLNATLQAEWRFLEHFTLEASGHLASHSRNQYVQQGYRGDYSGEINTYYVSSVSNLSEQHNHSFRGAAAYEQVFGKVGIKLRAGYELTKVATVYDQEKQSIGEGATVGEATPRYTTTVSYGGWFASTSLRLSDLWTLSGIIRENDIHRTTDREGFSFLSPDTKGRLSYGLHSVVSIDRLPFLAGVRGLDRLQLNVSLGQMGNQASSGDIRELTAGISFGLLNRIRGSLNWYDRTVSDSLSRAVYADILSPAKYTGPTIRNRGLEIELGGDLVKTSRFLVSLSGNLTLMNDLLVDTGNGAYNSGSFWCEKGHHPRSFYLPVYLGADPMTGKAMYLAMDTDDPNYNDAYAEKIFTRDGQRCTYYYYAAKSDWAGQAAPTLVGGVALVMKYKSLALALDGYFQAGGKCLDVGYRDLISANDSRCFGRLHTDLERSWKNPGDRTDVPMLDAGDYSYSMTPSRWLVSTDMFELTRACLSYDLATPFLKGVSGITVYVTADNFLMFSARDGVYPRQYAFNASVSGSVSAPARTVSLGARFSLGG